MAGMACWIGSFLAMHACLRRLARLDGPVALTISGLAVAAPVYEVLGDVSLAMYPACMLLFWCGWLLFAAALNCRGSAAIACRVAAVALLFLSFNVNSLLVMHYAVAATFAVLRLRDVPWGDMRARLVRAALRYPDILALPVVFWIWKAVFTPTSGFYATLQQALLRPTETGPGVHGRRARPARPHGPRPGLVAALAADGHRGRRRGTGSPEPRERLRFHQPMLLVVAKVTRCRWHGRRDPGAGCCEPRSRRSAEASGRRRVAGS